MTVETARYATFDHERNHGCRIRELVYRGHRCLTLENELLRVFVAADKGADILELLYKPLDMDFLWHSRGGLRPVTHFRPSTPLPAGHFREHFAGGWFEMLPGGPAPSSHRGAQLGHHGEATLLPWEYRIEVDEPGRIEVRFTVRLVRLPLVVEKVLRLDGGSATLRIRERVTSQAAHRVEILWGHHPTFGYPFIEEGCRVHLPPCRARVPDLVPEDSRLEPGRDRDWPGALARDGSIVDLSVIPGPESRSHDFVRLDGLETGRYDIVNPRRGLGFSLRWDARLFRTLGFWQLLRGGPDYPWYGMNYLVALEPACDFCSLEEAVARGTALTLEPGVPLETDLAASAFTDLAGADDHPLA